MSMSKKELKEKVGRIVEVTSDKFNALPYEKRVEMFEYIGEMQILTMWQLLHKNEELLCSKWKENVRSWLEWCIRDHFEHYMKEEKQ